MNGTDGRICYRCSAISWEKLRPEVTERVFVCAIKESVQELKRSSCPTCRVLGVAVDHRRLTKLEFASAVNQSRSIKLETTPDSTRSNLHLVYSRGLFSLKDNSHMLHAFPSPLKLCDRDDPYLLDLQADAPNRVDFELAKLWMADCGTHEKCNIPPKSDIDNLKVIDCHQRRIISAPEKCKFVALSYVWGSSMLEDCTQFPNLPSLLPRTVEDSIEATTLLGFQYLWVDRYCINQGDHNIQQQQINQMGLIYSSAQITLVAAFGSDANAGLPGVTRCRQRRELIMHAVTDRSRLVIQPWRTNKGPRALIAESTWFSRAWTFQEGYLSRRRMYFLENADVCICDEDPGVNMIGALTDQLAASLPNSAETQNRVGAIMREYTRRQLTYDSDALNAILGALGTLERTDHIWGVSLAQGENIRSYNALEIGMALDWEHLLPCSRRKGFPSWSPLGWRGTVNHCTFVPTVSSTCSVELWYDGDFKPPCKAFGRLAERSNDPLEDSKLLKLTTTVLRLDLEHLDDGPTNTAGLYVKVPYSKKIDLFVRPSWDVDYKSKRSLKKARIRLPCVVILRCPDNSRLERGTQEGKRILEERSLLFILQNHGSHYGGIGRFSMQNHKRGSVFARDKQGRPVYLTFPYDTDLHRYRDATCWMENGVRETFLLG